MKRNMRRNAFTLVETMVAIIVGVMIGLACQTLVSRADRLYDATRRQIELGTDVRALVETALKDVASAQQVLSASAEELVLVRAADAGVQERLRTNATHDAERAWAFPFGAGAGTTQRYPGLKVTYRFDRARRQVSRNEERGEMVAKSGSETPATLVEFGFEAAPGGAGDKVLCSAVKECAFKLLGYDDKGALSPLDAARPTAATVVLLDVHARYDEGLYADAKDRPVPDARLVVPLWLAKRRADAVLPEWFSSTDEDLSW
jgi:hypothetical protein